MARAEAEATEEAMGTKGILAVAALEMEDTHQGLVTKTTEVGLLRVEVMEIMDIRLVDLMESVDIHLVEVAEVVDILQLEVVEVVDFHLVGITEVVDILPVEVVVTRLVEATEMADTLQAALKAAMVGSHKMAGTSIEELLFIGKDFHKIREFVNSTLT